VNAPDRFARGGVPIRVSSALPDAVPIAVPMPPPPMLRIAVRRAARNDEVADVAALLLDHADPVAGPAMLARHVAETVAVACLGDDHLWQDLQLASRAELSALLWHWFPALAAKNDRDMKWKKFFYRELCAREDVLICKSPSCAACTDYDRCFGPEDA
jgi:nitrogen fixation protein NifQ